jgi:hypothetical protein
VSLDVVEARLEACRREYETNAEPHAVDAVRGSIQRLAETSLVAKAVKAFPVGIIDSPLIAATGGRPKP